MSGVSPTAGACHSAWPGQDKVQDKGQDQAPVPEAPLRLLVLEDNPVIAWQLAADLTALGQRVFGPFTTLEAACAFDGPIDGAIVDIGIGEDRSFAYAARLIDQGVAVVFYSGHAAEPVAGGLERVPRCAKPAPTSQLLATLRSQQARRRPQGYRALQRLPVWRRMARDICGDVELADQLLELAMERAIRHYETNPPAPGADPDDWLRQELSTLHGDWRRKRLV